MSFPGNPEPVGNILCPYENCGTYLNSANIGYHIRLVHEKAVSEFAYADYGKRVSDANFLEHLVSGVVSGAVNNVLSGANIPMKVYQCRVQGCSVAFSSNVELSKHVREVHHWESVESSSPKDYNTYVDRYYYPSDHLKVIYDEQKPTQESPAKQVLATSFNIDRCQKEDARPLQLSPVSSNSSNSEYSVSKCDASTSTKDLGAPRANIRHPTDHTKVKCPFEGCNTYIKPNSLSNHRRLVHDKIKKACDNCGKLISYLNLKSHFKRCTSDGEKRFVCEYEGCNAAFATVQYRSVHIKVVHEKIKKTCTNCGKEVSYMNYKSHIEKCTSDGEKRFPCTFPSCTSAFLTKYDRSVHISAIHRSPIKCPYENCTSYIKPVGLSQHIKLVHEKIRRNCQHCGRDFGLSNWKSHESRCKKNEKNQFTNMVACNGSQSSVNFSAGHKTNCQKADKPDFSNVHNPLQVAEVSLTFGQEKSDTILGFSSGHENSLGERREADLGKAIPGMPSNHENSCEKNEARLGGSILGSPSNHGNGCEKSENSGVGGSPLEFMTNRENRSEKTEKSSLNFPTDHEGSGEKNVKIDFTSIGGPPNVGETSLSFTCI